MVDEGSDSNPSEDDLDVKEIMQVVPIEFRSEIAIKPEIKEEKKELKKEQKKLVVDSKIASKNKQPNIKITTRRPQNIRKELHHMLRRDRHEIVEYIEMVDCYTQTTPRNGP